MNVAEEALRYDIDALRKNVERCKANVAIFEEAIEKEYQTINRLRQMIAVLEEKRARSNGR